MLIREITESRSRLDEIAPALVLAGQALYWGFMAYSAVQGIRAMYDVYSRWHDGEVTTEELRAQLGEEAFEMAKDLLFVHGGVKAAKMSWQAFRRLMNAARRQPPPTTSLRRDAAHVAGATAGYNLVPGSDEDNSMAMP